MPSYEVTFSTDSQHASVNIVAEDAKAALAEAKRQRDEEADILPWQNYDGNSFPINEICVEDEDGNEVAKWLSDEMRLSLAATKLLHALEEFLAQNMGDPEDLLEGDDPLREIYAKARAAVAELKGGAA